MQAARGASLTGDHEVDPPVRPRGSRGRLLLVFGLVAAIMYAVDVVSKIVAVDRLTDRPDVKIIGDLLVLHLVRNPGAAFSTGTAYTEVFTCLAIAAVVVICYLARRIGSLGWAFALGFLLAGVAGNLTDRLVREPGPLRGHVIDFFMLPHWPVFNVADICIDIAAGLILIQVFRGVRLDGTRTASQDEPAEDEAPGEVA
ncbi:peptidase A8, signal peptidase II [Nocardioides sp. Root1257]|uniref:signal peptidase II n=1 Tax=unclassified Nocardioides TaxID=2615069 RepID=UPI0006F52DF3|nr:MULTISPECIES: signal peptidase II [unclassified Nocardioides]KQW53320.1 peptidase A8, signal peptidase II [Nocardioides sp. Root1257]KRC56006.1 peptidase A8, signal peptidase II [Nocardioides sp. Root224]